MRTAGPPVFLGAFAATVLAACAGSPGTTPADARWNGVYIDGGPRIGASSSSVAPWEDGERSVETFEIQVRQSDDSVVRISDRITRFTDAEGRTTRIERVSSTGRDPVSVTIDIRDGVAVAVRKTRYDQNTLKVELPPSVRFDGGDDLLRGWGFAAKGDLSFENFSAGAMAVDRVVMRLLLADAATGERRIERSAYRGGALNAVSELTIDAGGNVVRTTLDMFGAHMVVRPISASEAAVPASPGSVLSSVMVKSPNRISTRAAQGRIRYVFGFNGGRVFDLPQTPDQTVTRADGEAVVDICLGCGPGLPTYPEFLAAGVRPTMWLQSGSEKLREIAALKPEEALNDRMKMDVLGRRVSRIMKTLDFNGHYSALEAAERGVGDCAEDAVLLTALARAAGIPAYVATGLVYSRERYHGVSNVFAPHNWVLAYVDGEWASFDISLGDFDATHIALSVNEGEASAMASAQQLASHLEWRRMVEVQQPPSPPQ